MSAPRLAGERKPTAAKPMVRSAIMISWAPCGWFVGVVVGGGWCGGVFI